MRVWVNAPAKGQDTGFGFRFDFVQSSCAHREFFHSFGIGLRDGVGVGFVLLTDGHGVSGKACG